MNFYDLCNGNKIHEEVLESQKREVNDFIF